LRPPRPSAGRLCRCALLPADRISPPGRSRARYRPTCDSGRHGWRNSAFVTAAGKYPEKENHLDLRDSQMDRFARRLGWRLAFQWLNPETFPWCRLRSTAPFPSVFAAGRENGACNRAAVGRAPAAAPAPPVELPCTVSRSNRRFQCCADLLFHLAARKQPARPGRPWTGPYDVRSATME
jgi:hypothetical protein